ncbi:caffeine-induced death protein 2-domain-containing protein [Echria macrotheca]|uniref:Caffeine-induced death protein 2-domain-containing protein n=1 Tax=Echria macrotheca TaxID=438768 RepID=A0AAJ0BJ39_9PEZI|nr:caffeine-induced death protein 2-domain-containing protein [Echria macrotheca]
MPGLAGPVAQPPIIFSLGIFDHPILSQTTSRASANFRNIIIHTFAHSNKLAGFLWSKRAAEDREEAEVARVATQRHDDMAQPLASPPLSPQFCFAPSALRDFLRISRSAVDDTITQHLNALVTPSKAGFDPSSTSQLKSRPFSHQIDARACQSFKEKVLFPTWEERSRVLTYCTAVATSPDPDDPEAALRQAELEKNKERVVDERLDPYSARFFPSEPRTERLASIIRLEQGVENIVRSRTWSIVNQRCGGTTEDWEKAIAQWRRNEANRAFSP